MSAVLHPACVIDAEVARDRVEPGRELGSTVELPGRLEHPHEDILRNVLGGLPVANGAQHEVIDGLLVAPEQPDIFLPSSSRRRQRLATSTTSREAGEKPTMW